MTTHVASSSSGTPSFGRATKRPKLNHWGKELVRAAGDLEQKLKDRNWMIPIMGEGDSILAILEDIRNQSVMTTGFLQKILNARIAHLESLQGSALTAATETTKELLLPRLQTLLAAVIAHDMPAPSLGPAYPHSPSLSPTLFAKDWLRHQNNDPDAHLCLRPPTCKGLPIGILHPAFATFYKIAAEPFPPNYVDQLAINADAAARELCATMGEQHKDELSVGDAFKTGLANLFSEDKWQNYVHVSLTTSERTARLDGLWFAEGDRSRLLREDKGDASRSACQPWMQVVHAYSWTIARREREDPTHQQNGGPMILFLVLGTDLLIAGAIYDGRVVTAEPLCPILPMLEDWTGRRDNRKELLARYLYAARYAHDELLNATYDVANTPGLPHPSLYDSPIEWETKHGRLSFTSQCTPHAPRVLLFNGTIVWKASGAEKPEQSAAVIIKLVYGSYGEKVHRYLAHEGLAPILYGKVKCSDVAMPDNIVPDAIVMETLALPTKSEDGWVPLYSFLRENKTNMVGGDDQIVFKGLVKIVNKLQVVKYVHGDFRSPNVMILVTGTSKKMVLGQDGEVQLKVVDFDWAGIAGEAKYPLGRNSVEKWPGIDGGPIAFDDDMTHLKSWWRASFPRFDFSSSVFLAQMSSIATPIG